MTYLLAPGPLNASGRANREPGPLREPWPGQVRCTREL